MVNWRNRDAGVCELTSSIPKLNESINIKNKSRSDFHVSDSNRKDDCDGETCGYIDETMTGDFKIIPWEKSGSLKKYRICTAGDTNKCFT